MKKFLSILLITSVVLLLSYATAISNDVSLDVGPAMCLKRMGLDKLDVKLPDKFSKIDLNQLNINHLHVTPEHVVLRYHSGPLPGNRDQDRYDFLVKVMNPDMSYTTLLLLYIPKGIKTMEAGTECWKYEDGKPISITCADAKELIKVFTIKKSVI